MSEIIGKLRRAGAFAYGAKAEESLFWEAADRIKEVEARMDSMIKQIQYHANTEYGATPYQLRRLLDDKPGQNLSSDSVGHK